MAIVPIVSSTLREHPQPGVPEPSASGRPVVAMAGAGQLARMTQQAAIPLGVELRVLADRPDDSAVLAGAAHRTATDDQLADLRALADGADVLTFDHEHIDPEHLATLEAEGVRLAPGAAAKLMAQDKLHARETLSGHGFPVPPFAHARTAADAQAFAEQHGWPLIGKTARGGYDGRGVFTLTDAEAAATLLDEIPDGLVLEPRLEIEQELAVVVARSAHGEVAVHPVVETVQQDAMCRELLVPAPVAPELEKRARTLATEIAEHIGATGILAVELFVVGGELLVNELALRPHNSGHFTIEGCVTSQFEQHLRATLGWPLGSTELTAPAVATVNVVGPADGSDPATRLPDALALPGVHVHLYGKSPRPGRKLGHVTVTGEDLDDVRSRARHAAAVLEGTTR